MKPKLALFLLALGCGAALHLPARAELNVVATLPDLGALAKEIGQGHIQLTSLARGTEDPHFVDARPSFVRVLNRADVLIEGGAELESGWLPPLLAAARNPRILGQARGRLVASVGLTLFEVPTGPLDRSQGDVHARGNPHYLLDPNNWREVAARVAPLFAELDPANAAAYRANHRAFLDRLATKTADWDQALAPSRGTAVVTYHKSFDYLLERFGFNLVGTIERMPGVEPSPAHINQLVPQAKAAGVRLVLVEPNRPRRTPEQVAQAIGAQLVVLPLMPGGVDRTDTLFGWFDHNVAQLRRALQ